MATKVKRLKLNGNSAKASANRKKPSLKLPLILISLVAVIEILYFICVYSSSPFISKWRTIYIETAMSTMSHQWLATAFIPESVIDEVMKGRYQMMENQAGATSSWENSQSGNSLTLKPAATDQSESGAQAAAKREFYELFYELDPDSMEAYIESNPSALDEGWMDIHINEAGRDKKGTAIETIYGEQVLALDAANGILLVRVKGDSYKGVLAIVKDPAQLSVAHARSLGSYGKFAYEIAEDSGALLAMNASGFYDPEGQGSGGTLGGLSVSKGQSAGVKALANYKRAEIREDNRIYIVNSYEGVDSGTRDAVEFLPALIVDGEKLVSGSDGWGVQPRSVIAQSENLEMLLLVVEGRQGPSNLGITIGECADILLTHKAVQALNLDGGSSTVMVYEGETITMCSNGDKRGRTLPNAFIVSPAD